MALASATTGEPSGGGNKAPEHGLAGGVPSNTNTSSMAAPSAASATSTTSNASHPQQGSHVLKAGYMKKLKVSTPLFRYFAARREQLRHARAAEDEDDHAPPLHPQTISI